jgi:hypothetical protein
MTGALTLSQQRSTVPILALSILVSILFSPALEDAIDRWLYVPAKISVDAVACKDGSCTWELRTMWR